MRKNKNEDKNEDKNELYEIGTCASCTHCDKRNVGYCVNAKIAEILVGWDRIITDVNNFGCSEWEGK